MRAVVVLFDSLSRRYLPSYGNSHVIAPNFERLEKMSQTFERYYTGSMPCMPARRDFQTGRYNFMHRCWGPMEPFDFSFIEELNHHEIYTHLVTDHSHYIQDGGATYHNRYRTFEIFRGQEGDRWMPQGLADNYEESQRLINKRGLSVIQQMANRTKIREETDFPTVRTINAGIEFLKNYADKDEWFLQIECLDPHEPFYSPEKYRRLYGLEEDGDPAEWPAYGKMQGGQKEDIESMRREYEALITMCDFHLGKIMDVMDEHDMWKDTLLIVTTDHGLMLGERGYLGKNFQPPYEELSHIPLYIHDPRGAMGVRRTALVQMIDMAPTLLAWFGIPLPLDLDGRDLFPVIRDDTSVHETILFGINGGHACIYDGEYIYMRAAVEEDNKSLINYTLMPTMMRGFVDKELLKRAELIKGNRFTNGIPCLKIAMKTYVDSFGFGSLLFDMKCDMNQINPLHDSETEKKMADKLIQAMKRIEAPQEEYVRLGLKQD